MLLGLGILCQVWDLAAYASCCVPASVFPLMWFEWLYVCWCIVAAARRHGQIRRFVGLTAQQGRLQIQVAGRCQARPAKSAGSSANDGPSKAVVKHDLEDLAKVAHIKGFSSCLTNLFVPRVSSIRWQPAHAVVGLKNTARPGGVGGCVCVCERRV